MDRLLRISPICNARVCPAQTLVFYEGLARYSLQVHPTVVEFPSLPIVQDCIGTVDRAQLRYRVRDYRSRSRLWP